ncbi:MAG TPA: DUF1573 domain-containing protein [Bacteroidia bacterium]|jgi:hypothetical protein
MKNTIFLAFVLLFHISIIAQETTISTGPKITFETEMMDYGIVAQGSNMQREFKFKNTGKSPLILTNVASSCGCLTSKWPKEPIAPGKTAVITAYYDTNRVGRFEKTLTVTSNADRPSVTLKIKGEVLAPAVKDASEVVTPK